MIGVLRSGGCFVSRATEFNLASIEFQLGKLRSHYSDRRQALARAAQLAQSQGLPEQLRLLIQARQLQGEGRSEDATRAYQAIVRRFPKELDPRMALGDLLKYQGRLSESAAVLEGRST